MNAAAGSRFAVISVGTNSCRLLIAVRDGQGTLRPDYHETRGTRLGEGVERTRELAPDAIERTLSAVHDYAALARGADRLFGIGTSALRDASNRDAFTERFATTAGAPIELLSGEEEALSSFEGALAGMRAAGASVPSAVSVVDVGGGSTEIATRDRDGASPQVRSLQIGAVRLTETSLAGDPPAPADIERSRRIVRSELEALPIDTRPHGAVVAVGGTATTAARILQAIDDRSMDGIATIAAADLDALLKATLAMPLRERLRLRGLPAQRADIFPAGLMIICEVVTFARATSLTVSGSDLLLGYITRHAT